MNLGRQVKVLGSIILLASSAAFFLRPSQQSFRAPDPHLNPNQEVTTPSSAKTPTDSRLSGTAKQSGTFIDQPSQESAAHRILSNESSIKERRQAIYKLTQIHSEEATALLQKIAETPIDQASPSLEFDRSLRLTALEALDQRIAGEEADASSVAKVLQKQTDPTLRFLAQVSYAGIASGHPGKLTRFIDETFAAAGEK